MIILIKIIITVVELVNIRDIKVSTINEVTFNERIKKVK
jgi:hypothetical protein